VLRISKLTDYGTLVLAQLAQSAEGLASAVQLADATRIAQPTVSKLLKSLARAGLVVSERGPLGGYALARSPEKISAAEIIDALEGPVAITQCSSVAGACDLEQYCRVASAWQSINRSIRIALKDVSLADLQENAMPLEPPQLKSALGRTRAAT
jgi:FeS assembly SUF system regulator